MATQLWRAIVFAFALGSVGVAPAAAQVCTTTGAGVSAATVCSDGTDAYTTCTYGSCTTQVFPGSTATNTFQPPPPPPLLPSPPPMLFYVEPPRPGLDYIDAYGVPRYFSQGTFLKADDALTIYVIIDQQFHTIQSWGSFLRHGGQRDLSNVVTWSTLSNWPAKYFGSDMPD